RVRQLPAEGNPPAALDSLCLCGSFIWIIYFLEVFNFERRLSPLQNDLDILEALLELNGS
ncbi:MAG: hypothetical protein NWQ28_03445, partial [Nodularia sp. (in: cyanobacteria)]|nr:hypothetical protein [Nodularia sp. (in: cyanobacteria)]